MDTEKGESNFDTTDFLSTFFEDEFNNPNPQWREVETPTAIWRVVAIKASTRMVIAVRTSEHGQIDSYSLDLDRPDVFEHIEVDAGLSHYGALQEAQAQLDMGLTAPNSEEQGQFNELVDALRLMGSAE